MAFCSTASSVVGLAVGISVAVFILFVICPIVICVLIWCCVAGALGAAFRTSNRPVTQTVTTTGPPTTAGVIIASTTQVGGIYMPKQHTHTHTNTHIIMETHTHTHTHTHTTIHIHALINKTMLYNKLYNSSRNVPFLLVCRYW